MLSDDMQLRNLAVSYSLQGMASPNAPVPPVDNIQDYFNEVTVGAEKIYAFLSYVQPETNVQVGP